MAQADRLRRREERAAAEARAEGEGWLGRPAEPALFAALAVAFALFFGLITRWVVFEYDLFWHVRAAAEILSGAPVQRVDAWSFTARGRPWFNFQWLSTVVDALVYRAAQGRYAVFSDLRAVLVGLWILALVGFVRRGSGEGPVAFALAILLVPWAYLACAFRLQMRPDLYAFACYALLLLSSLSRWRPAVKRAAGLAILLAWANFHSGTILFGLLFFAAAVALDPEAPRERFAVKAVFVAGAVATWFLTPIGWHVIGVVRTALTYDYALTGNPDLRPFDLSLLEYRNGGFSLLLWAAYTLLSVACTFLARRRPLPGPYRRFGFVVLVGAALTALALKNVRALPYQMVFLLPVVAAGLSELRARASRRRWARRATRLAWAAAVVSILGLALPDQVRYVAKPLGAEVYDVEIPVESTAFLKAHRPAGQLLNAYRFGGYLVGELPEYPVAIDGRDFPFFAFRREMRASMASPESFAAFLRRRQVNTVLETFPGMTYQPGQGFSDTHALLYPKSEWAQVFFDNVSVVYLRRIPQNAALIEQFEYRSLRRGLPANFGAEFRGLDAATRASFESEIDRCLRENPRCAYCLVGKAAFEQARGDHAAALERLRRALDIDRLNAAALLELAAVQDSLHRPEEAARARRRFEHVTTPQLAP
ncbi:MAG TPA: hypothetical protein VMG32_05090 [Anaeromyxobacteraceae bacterium]|nr:hypothetical protein [Anaeromyxobacteraceae bacterium]